MALLEVENTDCAGKCCIALHPSAEYLYMGNEEGIVKQYSYGLSSKKLQITKTLDDADVRHDEPINEISFSSTGDYFAYSSEDGEVTLVRHPTGSSPKILSKYDNGVSSICFGPDKYSFLLAMATDDGKIKFVNALKANENFYEFVCNPDGIRNIKWVKYEPLKYRAAREKYLAVAQCNGNFTIWKVYNQIIFNQEEKNKDKKTVKTHEFERVFPKIKGGDINQRLKFDSTDNAKMIAIPGNNNVKILDMNDMTFKATNNMMHNHAINCCVFNKYLESVDNDNYILATSDIKGNVKIWNIKYNENIFETEEIDSYSIDNPICELVWKNKDELLCCSMNGNIYKYIVEHEQQQQNKQEKKVDMDTNGITDDPMPEQKENSFIDASMDVDQEEEDQLQQATKPISALIPKAKPDEVRDDDGDDGMESKQVEEEKTVEEVVKNKKNKFEDDSDEDFDIDMNEEPSPKKKILRRSFIDDEDEDDSPSPPTQIQPTTKTPKAEVIPVAKKEIINKNPTQNTATSLEAEMAAAAEMFGDDNDGLFQENNDQKNNIVSEKSNESHSRFNKDIFKEQEAEDLGMNKKQEKQEEMMMDQDTGEDLKDFIVDENDATPTKGKKNKKRSKSGDDEMMDDVEDIYDQSPRNRGSRRVSDSYKQQPLHEPFTNGATNYDDDGQRYLLFNQIGAVIARKQNMSTNAMEMNNIMSSLNNTKYSYEIDFFDKSKFTRAVTIKTDHHFTCCDVNSFGLLLGSNPDQSSLNNIDDVDFNDNDVIKESIIRYKPISRNNQYRSFSSEKDCEWTHQLPIGEVCTSVGLTNKYALIATNKRYLRILSIGGLQTHQIIQLPKTVINIAGNVTDRKSNIVAVLFEDLSLMVIDLDVMDKRVYDGKVALTNDECKVSRMFIVGDKEKWKLIVIDSENVVKMLSNNTFGWNWIVILDINEWMNKKYPINDEMNAISDIRPKGIWPIYFDLEEKCLMVMELKFLDIPIPSQATNGGYILTDCKLGIPLLDMGLNEIDPVTEKVIVTFGNKEEEIMRDDVMYLIGDKNDNKDGSKQRNKQRLKDYLMLFQHACKSNKYVLAYDIAIHFLSTEKAISNAIKIAMHNNIPLLAEQLTNLAKNRLADKDNKNNDNNDKENRNNKSINHNHNYNHKQRMLKRPTRTLKKPSAKLLSVSNNNNKNNNNNNINDITNEMRSTQLIGTKRKMNDKDTFSGEPPKKRNPFSCSNNNKNNDNENRNNNSIFRC